MHSGFTYHTLARQIILTLAYTAQFGYPLKAHEVWVRLIYPTIQPFAPTNVGWSFHHVQTTLDQLSTKGLILKKGEYYEMPDGVSFVASQSFDKPNTLSRQEKHLLSAQKWGEAHMVAQLLGWLPWVSGISVTGSLAMNSNKPDDDIDFLIVTTAHRLWLTRIVVSICAFLAGKRRSWAKEEPNSWCFNLWLEEVALTTPRKDIYTAYELCQAEWLLQKDQVVRNFLCHNVWVARLLPHYYLYRLKQPVLTHDRIFGTRLWGVSYMLDVLNLLAYIFQRAYMRSHQTTEQVSYRSAFFHPRDTKAMIIKNWQDILTHKI